MASKSLYVGNLPHGTNEEELKELFAQWDPADIRLIRDKGFGFVDVVEDKAAEAIAAMNGKDFKGRPLTVNEARPRAIAPVVTGAVAADSAAAVVAAAAAPAGPTTLVIGVEN